MSGPIREAPCIPDLRRNSDKDRLKDLDRIVNQTRANKKGGRPNRETRSEAARQGIDLGAQGRRHAWSPTMAQPASSLMQNSAPQ